MLGIETIEGKIVYLKDIERILNKGAGTILISTKDRKNIIIKGTKLENIVKELLNNENVDIIPVGISMIEDEIEKREIVDIINRQRKEGNNTENVFLYIGDAGLFNIDNIKTIQSFCYKEYNNYFIEVILCSGEKVIINNINTINGTSKASFLKDIMRYLDKQIELAGRKRRNNIIWNKEAINKNFIITDTTPVKEEE